MARSERRKSRAEGPPSRVRAVPFDGGTSGTWERPEKAALVARVEAIVARATAGQGWEDRRGLLDELAALLAHPDLPDTAKQLGLELAGKLARRVDGESACCRGLAEMRERYRARGR